MSLPPASGQSFMPLPLPKKGTTGGKRMSPFHDVNFYVGCGSKCSRVGDKIEPYVTDVIYGEFTESGA